MTLHGIVSAFLGAPSAGHTKEADTLQLVFRISDQKFYRKGVKDYLHFVMLPP